MNEDRDGIEDRGRIEDRGGGELGSRGAATLGLGWVGDVLGRRAFGLCEFDEVRRTSTEALGAILGPQRALPLLRDLLGDAYGAGGPSPPLEERLRAHRMLPEPLEETRGVLSPGSPAALVHPPMAARLALLAGCASLAACAAGGAEPPSAVPVVELCLSTLALDPVGDEELSKTQRGCIELLAGVVLAGLLRLVGGAPAGELAASVRKLMATAFGGGAVQARVCCLNALLLAAQRADGKALQRLARSVVGPSLRSLERGAAPSGKSASAAGAAERSSAAERGKSSAAAERGKSSAAAETNEASAAAETNERSAAAEGERAAAAAAAEREGLPEGLARAAAIRLLAFVAMGGGAGGDAVEMARAAVAGLGARVEEEVDASVQLLLALAAKAEGWLVDAGPAGVSALRAALEGAARRIRAPKTRAAAKKLLELLR